MNKGQLTFIWLLLLVSSAYAVSTRIIWNDIPVKKDVARYENKEYGTPQEYIEALQEGKCSSTWVWVHLDRDTKLTLIEGLKQMFKEKSNVIICKPTQFYVDAINEMIEADSEAQYYKLGVIFKTIAIMEYDFDEGVDKDETARKWLGEDLYKAVRGGTR